MARKATVKTPSDNIPATVIEPSRYAEKLRAALDKEWAFPRGWVKDSGAMTPFVFAIVLWIVIGVCVYSGVESGFVTPLLVIIAVCLLLSVILLGVSLALYRSHRAQPVHMDLFAADGHLFNISWMGDKNASGEGTVRIHVVPIDACEGYLNKKDGVVWIIPSKQSAIRDVWREGHRWAERRELCWKLLASGVRGKGDSDPFFGVYEEFSDFLDRIGVPIEETTEPVDFIAGTARF